MPQTPDTILSQVGALALAAAAAVFQRLVAAARLRLVDHQLPRAAFHLLSAAFLLSSVAFHLPYAVLQ